MSHGIRTRIQTDKPSIRRINNVLIVVYADTATAEAVEKAFQLDKEGALLGVKQAEPAMPANG